MNVEYRRVDPGTLLPWDIIGTEMSLVPFHLWQSETLPTGSGATALGKVGPTPHLDNATELTLEVKEQVSQS